MRVRVGCRAVCVPRRLSANALCDCVRLLWASRRKRLAAMRLSVSQRPARPAAPAAASAKPQRRVDDAAQQQQQQQKQQQQPQPQQATRPKPGRKPEAAPQPQVMAWPVPRAKYSIVPRQCCGLAHHCQYPSCTRGVSLCDAVGSVVATPFPSAQRYEVCRSAYMLTASLRWGAGRHHRAQQRHGGVRGGVCGGV